MAVRQAALVREESTLEACLRRCAIQIDDLYLLPFTFIKAKNKNLVVAIVLLTKLTAKSALQSQCEVAADWHELTMLCNYKAYPHTLPA